MIQSALSWISTPSCECAVTLHCRSNLMMTEPAGIAWDEVALDDRVSPSSVSKSLRGLNFTQYPQYCTRRCLSDGRGQCGELANCAVFDACAGWRLGFDSRNVARRVVLVAADATTKKLFHSSECTQLHRTVLQSLVLSLLVVGCVAFSHPSSSCSLSMGKSGTRRNNIPNPGAFRLAARQSLRHGLVQGCMPRKPYVRGYHMKEIDGGRFLVLGVVVRSAASRAL